MIREKYRYIFEPELLDELEKTATIKNVMEGEILMDIGQKVSMMPLIISGSIKIMSEDENGNELLLYYIETGDTCAMTIQCCVGRKRSKIRAEAEEPSTIAFLPIQKMEEWLIRYHSWRAFILESYDSRLQEMLEAIDSLAFHNLEERLYKYLRDKAMVTGKVQIKTTHYQIANDLNSSRVVISRLMKKLEQDGKVKQGRKTVDVLEFG